MYLENSDSVSTVFVDTTDTANTKHFLRKLGVIVRAGNSGKSHSAIGGEA